MKILLQDHRKKSNNISADGIFADYDSKKLLKNMVFLRSSIPIKVASLPARLSRKSLKIMGSKSAWMAKAAGWTTYLSSGYGAA
jgi:hypothetical protein